MIAQSIQLDTFFTVSTLKFALCRRERFWNLIILATDLFKLWKVQDLRLTVQVYNTEEVLKGLQMFASYNCSFAVCTNIWNIVLNVTVGYYYSCWIILTMNMAQIFKLSCKCMHYKAGDIMNCLLNWEPILRSKCKKEKGTSV